MPRRMLVVVLMVVAAALCLSGELAMAGERRVALVMGNGAYRHTQPLPNPKNDAFAMAEALKRLGFEVLTGYDLGFHETGRLISRFAEASASADVALLFYAGHGMQVGGKNYLIPVDSELASEANVRFEAVGLDEFLGQMAPASGINLVFLDACRDNPLIKKLRSTRQPSRAVGDDRGLARVDSKGDAFVAFATDPDATAADGLGEHSPFTAALLKHIATPGIEIESMMRRVNQDVRDATRGKQRPWTNSSLTRAFAFRPDGQSPAVAGYMKTEPKAGSPQPTRPDTTTSTARCDDLFLESKQQRDRIKAMGEFRQLCSSHPKAAEAQRLQEQALDSRNCDRALSERTISALQDYLDAHPAGRCKSEVKVELDKKLAEQRRATEQDRADAEARRAAEELARQDQERRAREEDLRRQEQEVAEQERRKRDAELDRRKKELEQRQARLNAPEPQRTWTPPAEDAAPAAPAITGPSFWNHNGSTMKLVADGARRRFYYESPRQGMRAEGVTSGTLLFDGARSGDSYAGTAYVFSGRCGRKYTYQVSGNVSADERSVTMYGQAPRLDARCNVMGSRTDELVFQLLGD